MDPAAARHVAEATLRLSKAPTAELAAAALEAQEAAGLERADFIVVAVPPGTAPATVDAVAAAAASVDVPLVERHVR